LATQHLQRQPAAVCRARHTQRHAHTAKPEGATDAAQDIAFVLLGSPGAECDSIDFNRNDVYPEDQDVIDFFQVLAGGACPYADPCDIDFNNNDVYPEDQDVIDFFNTLAGGVCG
jgi:hypothetical protein